MSESKRMIQPGSPPNDTEVAAWIGDHAFEYWKQITSLIDGKYPGVFVPEWLFGGKKHGWSLRYKKTKSFCTLIPEKDHLAVLIVFGGEERQKVETVKDQLSVETREEYEKATTYQDGKWVLLTVDSDTVVEDLQLLLGVKRRPKYEKSAEQRGGLRQGEETMKEAIITRDTANQVASRSEELFRKGLFCAESVLQAVAESQNITNELIPSIATGLCSGIARTGGLCGAVGGAILAINMLCGRDDATRTVESNYEAVRDFLRRYEATFGNTNCYELIGCRLDTPEGQVFFKENNLWDKCLIFTREAGRLAILSLGAVADAEATQAVER